MGKALLPLLIVAAAYAVEAKAQANTLEIEVLISEAGQPAFEATLKGFRKALVLQGFDPRFSIIAMADAAQLSQSKAAFIFTLGTPATARAVQLAPVPVIFAAVGDPAAIDLMTEARLPKKRATGVSLLVPAFSQLSLVGSAAPDTKRLGVVYAETCSPQVIAELKKETIARGLTFVPIVVSSPAAVGIELSKREREVDALLAVADAAVWNAASVKGAVIFSIQKKKPLFGFSSAFTRAGAIASVSAEDYEDIGAQAAISALALAVGAQVERMAIVAPRKLTISINLVVARRIGIEPSRQLVDRAEVVFR